MCAETKSFQNPESQNLNTILKVIIVSCADLGNRLKSVQLQVYSENNDPETLILNIYFSKGRIKLNVQLPSSARVPRRFRPAASRPRPSLRGSYVKCKNVFTPNCGTVVSLATSLTTESNKIIKITQLKKKNKDLKRRLRNSPSQGRFLPHPAKRRREDPGAGRFHRAATGFYSFCTVSARNLI